MAKRKTDYLRGLSRAAYNALQRYNRLARQDGMKTLAPGAVKRFAREQGVSAYEFIRKAEETNIAPRVSKKEEAMIRRLRAIEKRAGKVPTSTAAIRRSIAAAKAKKISPEQQQMFTSLLGSSTLVFAFQFDYQQGKDVTLPEAVAKAAKTEE